MNNKRIDGKTGFPDRHGLYDPALEKDSCGVGFVAHVKGIPSHEILTDANHINERMDHRGGCGFEESIPATVPAYSPPSPTNSCRKVAAELGITLPKAGTYAVGNLFLPQDDTRRAELKVESGDRPDGRGAYRPRFPGSAHQAGRGRYRPGCPRCDALHRADHCRWRLRRPG